MSRVFVSWSGGKDCCLAAYRAAASGLTIGYLANMVTADGKRSCSHGISAHLIEMQSQAMGTPLIQQRNGPDDYEIKFKEMIGTMKKEGITGGVFGDIDFGPHREWVERVCAEAGIVPYLPLWGESQEKLLSEFVGLGFEAVVIVVKSDILGREWLGRKVDASFVSGIQELSRAGAITPCGEAGEYHTLVIDGALFKRRIEITEARRVLREGHWFLEISGVSLRQSLYSTNSITQQTYYLRFPN